MAYIGDLFMYCCDCGEPDPYCYCAGDLVAEQSEVARRVEVRFPDGSMKEV